MKRFRIAGCVIGLVTCLCIPIHAACADILDDIYALADRKEYDKALKQLGGYLSEHPKDAQGRFLKGLILTETRQRDQAINVFLQLSKDYPELPEPYNNLAVLYAEQGHFEKAQEALQQAIKSHPNYATAHENLGDIYAKMASQSYARAVKLNPGSTLLTSKLNKVKTLFIDGVADAATGGAAASVRPGAEPAVKSASPAKPVKPVDVAKVTEVVADKEKIDLPSPPSASAPVTPSQSSSTATPPVVAKTSDNADKSKDPKTIDEVQKAVHAWAAAWSAKDMDHYINAYSDNFQPVSKNFKSRAAWEKNRRDVIGRSGDIQVRVTDLYITMLNENRVQATFMQNYSSKSYHDKIKKTMSFEREKNVWKIVREYANE